MCLQHASHQLQDPLLVACDTEYSLPGWGEDALEWLHEHLDLRTVNIHYPRVVLEFACNSLHPAPATRSPCLLSDERSIHSMLNHWSQHKKKLCTVDIPWDAVHSILQVRCCLVAGLRLQLRTAEVVIPHEKRGDHQLRAVKASSLAQYYECEGRARDLHRAPHHVLQGALQNAQLPKIRVRMVLPCPLMRNEDGIAHVRLVPDQSLFLH
mmetsp:Transcript_68389/g.160353  ORF Transcript_68389/g.160353 Transcript_68389/m.160353 type:complete len:210 (+) Transcript_68389:1270-1899(+)